MSSHFPRITVNPALCQGQPCIRGLRIPVSVVLVHLAAGKGAAQVLDEFPELEPEDITESLRFAVALASGRPIAPDERWKC